MNPNQTDGSIPRCVYCNRKWPYITGVCGICRFHLKQVWISDGCGRQIQDPERELRILAHQERVEREMKRIGRERESA